MGGFLVDLAATVGTKTPKEVRFCRSLETSLLVRSGALGEPLLLGSCSSKRPYGQLVVALRRVRLLADQGSYQAAEEPGRDRDQLCVTQQEPVELALGTSDVGVLDTTGEKVMRSIRRRC
jgi:hypothetical protein